MIKKPCLLPTEKPSRNQRDLGDIHYNCSASVANLIEEGHIEEIFSEEEIMEKIQDYLSKHLDEILEFLGDDGKVLIPMNSAEKFADIVIEKLGISKDRITKFKVTTYENGISTERLLSQDDKEKLKEAMGLEMQDTVFIIEDLLDTGHTVRMLDDFLNSHLSKTKILCLFDKHVDESEEARMQLGDRFTSIINVGEEFILGFGMDYQHRLCADMKGLWKIKEGSIEIVTELLNIFTKKIEHILKRPDQP